MVNGKSEAANFSELTFDERKHIYKLNGLEIPSVTTVMKPLSDDYYSGISDEIICRAGRRGTAVHNAIENYVKFGVDDISPDYSGYFNAFLKWVEEHNVVPYGSEMRLYHKSLLYAGTADMFASVDYIDTLIDFKTTSTVSQMMCGVQLEAYDRAMTSHVECGSFSNKAIVHLRKDGRYEMVPFVAGDTECWKVFTSLLTVWSYKQKFKR